MFEGKAYSFPGDATDAEVRDVLSGRLADENARPQSPQDPWSAFQDAPARETPPLPQGFTLDTPTQALPPLPPGFTLDQAQPSPQQPVETTPGGVPIGPNGVPRVDMSAASQVPAAPAERSVSLLPSSVGGAIRDFRVGSQGVGAGLRDIALAPFDLAAGAQNLVTGGVNKVFGTNIPPATPASQIADNITAPFSIPEQDMSQSEKLFSNINRFGTQGVAGGSLLATRAPAIADAAMTGGRPAGNVVDRTLDTLARPYQGSPVRTVAGDAVGGVGAGTAVTAADEYLPKEPTTPTGQALKAAANFLAPLAGGAGAVTLQGAGEGIAGLIRSLFNRRADVNVPVNAAGRPYTVADTNRAAEDLQNRVTSTTPRDVAYEIRQNAQGLEDAGFAPSEMPTSGLLSRDPGLVAAETGARVRNNGEFINRDQNVKQAAGERVNSIRDPEGQPQFGGPVTSAAQMARDNRIGQVDAEIGRIQARNDRMDQAFRDWQSQFSPIATSEARANASRNLDRTIVDEGYVPARAEKNRQFNEAPGRTEQLPADDVFAAIDRVRQGINQLGPAGQQFPAEFVRRLEALRPQMVDRETQILGANGQPLTMQENIGGPGTALGGDLADLRKYLGTAHQTAQQSGNFDLADNINALRQAVNRTIEEAPGYAEANANYGRFADRYRPERGDEMAKFTREIDRSGNTDGTPNRGSTPPSETAGRFLSSPEKAATLQRVLDGAPSAQAGQAAVRDYMRSDFATTALNPDGTINPARASAWARNNADVLAQFPQLRTEFDGLVQTAQRGETLSNTARSELDTARRSRNATETEIDRSAVGTLLREDPRDVASRILNGGYGTERQLDEITAMVRNDPAAARGWKAAVSEVLTDKVNSTRKVGETPEVQYARLAKEFKDNEGLLAKVYTPEEMNTLRQGHTLLGYFKEAEKRATVGSNTADKAAQIPSWVQLAARHVYGDLKGGGVIKRFKLLLELLPSNRQNAEEIVHMAWFNPDVAAYLLEKKVRNPDIPQYNISLRRLLAADNAARESGPNDRRVDFR